MTRDPLEPIPPTAEAFELLRGDDEGIESDVRRLAEEVRALVPAVVGVSLSFREPAVTFTLAATARDLATLDAVQYLHDGPCVAAVREGELHEVRETDDVLSEARWSAYARASAHLGIRSSLSVPVRLEGEVVGGLNVYAATVDAFDGRADAVAALVQAPVGSAVRDADLSFSSRLRAEQSVRTMENQITVDVAAGMLAEREHITVDEAITRLEQAAAQAGVPVASLAVLLIDSHCED